MVHTYESALYLQVRPAAVPRWSGNDNNTLQVVRTSTRRPTILEADCVLLKIKIRVPGQVFRPIEPVAVVDIPAELVQREIVVEAGDPE